MAPNLRTNLDATRTPFTWTSRMDMTTRQIRRENEPLFFYWGRLAAILMGSDIRSSSYIGQGNSLILRPG